MRLANVSGRAAVLVGDKVLDIETASAGALSSDLVVLCDLAVRPELQALVDAADPSALPTLDPATLGAPVTRPSKVVALAINYAKHAQESNRDLPSEPHVMVKFPSSIVGPYDEIVVPAGRDQVDYETEIVIAIGRRFTAISEEDAWDVVAGVTGGQDVSDRGEQFRPPVKQFSMAKSYDTFSPIGPVLVTTDELTDRDDLELTGWLNGEQMQSARTSDFIFSIPRMLAWLSRFVTFEVGDLIYTGTPGGVGEAQQPPRYLRAGDVVETEISQVGRMRNPVVER
ncbi:fumarylacetoacetate hydrolase family protein [Angustibacter luteus]|uniref:Fumarylacetoacetate hydrolase family protein n=1 Tax=Angustibacter luteus TaxID=658456 RepID=A0ABW1JE88_9ACTN